MRTSGKTSNGSRAVELEPKQAIDSNARKTIIVDAEENRFHRKHSAASRRDHFRNLLRREWSTLRYLFFFVLSGVCVVRWMGILDSVALIRLFSQSPAGQLTGVATLLVLLWSPWVIGVIAAVIWMNRPWAEMAKLLLELPESMAFPGLIAFAFCGWAWHAGKEKMRKDRDSVARLDKEYRLYASVRDSE